MCVHAKRNEKNLSMKSRSPKNGKPSHNVVVRNKVTIRRRIDDDGPIRRRIKLSRSKKTGLEFC